MPKSKHRKSQKQKVQHQRTMVQNEQKAKKRAFDKFIEELTLKQKREFVKELVSQNEQAQKQIEEQKTELERGIVLTETQKDDVVEKPKRTRKPKVEAVVEETVSEKPKRTRKPKVEAV